MDELFNNVIDADKIRLLQIMEGYSRKYEKNKIILSSVKMMILYVFYYPVIFR